MMNLKIITPTGCMVDAEAFEVLTNHAPLISTLDKGIVRYEQDGVMQEYAVETGFVKVDNNTIVVCTER